MTKNIGLIAFLFAIMLAVPGYSQDTSASEKYTVIEIEASHEDMAFFSSLGIALDCCGHEARGDRHLFTVPVNASDLSMLNQHRVSYKVVAENAVDFYAPKNDRDEMGKAEEIRASLATDMQYGSFAGFYSVDEIAQNMDKLYAKYGSKNLITQKKSIGKTHEGRDIFMVKISDNASSDEAEPQALYTAMHHAREPQGMMTVFYFMYYLLENYETDQRVRSIVDGRELYFVPIVNPDGYAYNQKNAPNGGGMHRKNRNPGSSVDLNRNYGPYEIWNYPNSGSSTSPSSDTYRGSAPFSEPETKALSEFSRGKKFKNALHYHTYSNLLIYPWGYKDAVAHPMFDTMARAMTKQNGYRYGTAPDLLYPVRGVSDDWYYQEIQVFAMTPEVGSGSDGFWPSRTRIFPLAQINLEANLLLAEYAGQLK